MSARTLEVRRAAAMGMCFGVRDALAVAAATEQPTDVTIYGELVHNEAVLADLQQRGFHLVSEADRGAAVTGVTTKTVLLTAHGVSNRERETLTASGRALIDTTCPLVRKVHNAALRLQGADYEMVVIGRHGHVEVRGITGDLRQCHVVATVEEAESAPLRSDRIGVVCQTTFPEALAEQIVAALRRRRPAAEVRFVNTVCEPTRQRQAAMADLLAEVDAVVVVGGQNSNNSQQLVRTSAAAGVPAWLVQGPGDLEPGWFADCRVVGLTAGTSTLQATIDAVEAALLRIPARSKTPTAT